jgi:hypothetical protein
MEFILIACVNYIKDIINNIFKLINTKFTIYFTIPTRGEYSSSLRSDVCIPTPYPSPPHFAEETSDTRIPRSTTPCHSWTFPASCLPPTHRPITIHKLVPLPSCKVEKPPPRPIGSRVFLRPGQGQTTIPPDLSWTALTTPVTSNCSALDILTDPDTHSYRDPDKVAEHNVAIATMRYVTIAEKRDCKWGIGAPPHRL